ncbi:MAG TPA: hypothetical protein VED59_04140 [Acidimicrobiales bacterium]|nr:hypothetical protein [Acidimicrobiales bacterium]
MAVLFCLAAAGAMTGAASPEAPADWLALADPPANLAPTPAMQRACIEAQSSSCQRAVVAAIDQARAPEGLGPIRLPSDYSSLGSRSQLLVLADLERVDRGLPGFSGLSSGLDGLAQDAALSSTDPVGPADSTWGSNWAGGEASALAADYDWMYNDGLGSPNIDCASSGASGCWDHRHNVLGNYGRTPSMGAAATMVGGVTSMTELFSSLSPGTLDCSLSSALPVTHS